VSLSKHDLNSPRFPCIRCAQDVYSEMLWAVDHWDRVLLVQALLPGSREAGSESESESNSPSSFSACASTEVLLRRFRDSLKKINHLSDYLAYESAWAEDETAARRLKEFVQEQLASTNLRHLTVKEFHDRLWPSLWPRWDAFIQARHALFCAQMRILHMAINYSVRRSFESSFGGDQKWAITGLDELLLETGPYRGSGRCLAATVMVEETSEEQSGKPKKERTGMPPSSTHTHSTQVTGRSTPRVNTHRVSTPRVRVVPPKAPPRDANLDPPSTSTSASVPTSSSTIIPPSSHLQPDYNNYLSVFINYYDHRGPDELPLKTVRFSNKTVATAHQSEAQKWVVHQLQLQVKLQMHHQFGGISGDKIGQCHAGWSGGGWRRISRGVVKKEACQAAAISPPQEPSIGTQKQKEPSSPSVGWTISPSTADIEASKPGEHHLEKEGFGIECSPCGSCIGEERELYHHRDAGVWYGYRNTHWRRPKSTIYGV